VVVWWGRRVHVEPHRHANEQIVWMLKGKMEFRLGTEQRTCGPGDVMVIPGGSEEHEAWLHKDTEVIDGAVVKRSYLRFEHSSLATAVSSLLTALTGSSPNSCSCARSIRARRSTASRVWSRTSCVPAGMTATSDAAASASAKADFANVPTRSRTCLGLRPHSRANCCQSLPVR
jgi:hypothetical protein